MRRAALFVPIVLALSAAPLCAQKVCLVAELNGASEVPPVATMARGTVFAVVDMGANTLTLSLTFDGMATAETAAHIHGFAPPGVNAAVLFPLPVGKHKNVVLNYLQADEASIVNGLTYVNVHSLAFPGGEIRGQLVRDDSAVVFTAVLNGNQEVPPVPTMGAGTAFLSIDTVANTLSYNITHAMLSSPETAAHIHGFAPPGVSTGIKHNLPAGFHKVGVWNYVQADEAGILAGQTYINIHSSNFGGGEIRGQVNPTCSNADDYCVGKTNSLGCVPMIGWSGEPTVSGPDDFFVTASMKLNNQPGVFFFGRSPASIPFQGATLCVNPPVIRSAVMNSGGNPPPSDCSGTYSLHLSHANMAANAMLPGDMLFGQFWSRDPGDPFGTSLSNAIHFAIRP